MSALLVRPCAALPAVAVCLLLAGPSRAAISTIGDVTPDPNTTTSSDDLYIGDTAAGVMLIDAGSEVASQCSYIGHDAGIIGSVIVDGDNSTWFNSSYAYVGYSGTGMLAITGGGWAGSVNGDPAMYIGFNAGSTGTVTVDGTDSVWNAKMLNVGYSGTGTLCVSGGGTVVGGGISGGNIGYNSGSTGTVTITGVGSNWLYGEPEGTLVVGVGGTGILNIQDGGCVSSPGAMLASRVGSTSVVTVGGPASNWTIGGLLIGYRGEAAVLINGGTVTVSSDVSLSTRDTADATLDLADGTLCMYGGGLRKGAGKAAFNFTGGRLEGAGTIDLGASLVQNGGTLAPGNSAGTTAIEGGYTLDGGALEIEINGLGTAGTDWDLVQVNGSVDLVGNNGLLDGLLNVILGFAPTLSDEFLVLDNDDTDPIIGTFATWTTAKAPYGGNLYQFTIDYAAGDGNDIALVSQGAVGLLGDYNGDGAVDAADYTVWRDALGTSVARYFGADGNGNGIVDEADHLVWKTYFGATAAGGAGATGSANAAVPEPATMLLLALAVLGKVPLLRCRRARPR